MTDAHDAIPADGTYLLDAFKLVFRRQTPDWQAIEQNVIDPSIGLIDCSDHLKTKKLQSDLDEALIRLDDAHFKANELLRNLIIDGALTAYIRDPVADIVLRLPSNGWDRRVLIKPEITSSFVGPDDKEAPGPDTVIAGARRPVFFKTADLQELLFAKIESHSERRRAGRPSHLPIVEAQLDRLILKPRAALHSSNRAAARSLIAWFKSEHRELKAPSVTTVTNRLSKKLEKITKPKTE